MSATRIFRIPVFEGEGLPIRHRMKKADGTDFVQSDVVAGTGANQGVKVTVYDLQGNTPRTPVYETDGTSPVNLDRANVMQTAATLDGSWEEDDIGYVFYYTLLHDASFATGIDMKGGKLYRADFLFYSTGGNRHFVVDIPVKLISP